MLMVVEQTISLGIPSPSISETADELWLLNEYSLEEDELTSLLEEELRSLLEDEEEVLLEEETLDEEDTLLEEETLDEEETLLEEDDEEAIASPAITTPSMRKSSWLLFELVRKRKRKEEFANPPGRANADCVVQELS